MAPAVTGQDIARVYTHRVGRFTSNTWRDTLWQVIKSFRDEDTWAVFQRRPIPKFQHIARVAYRKLVQVNQAKKLADLGLPGNRLEPLKGNRAGQHSIRINDRYRVCFVWRNNDAHDVEIVDYH